MKLEKIRTIVKEIIKLKPEKVLHVSCGDGKLVSLLRYQEIDAWGSTNEKEGCTETGCCVRARENDLPFGDEEYSHVIYFGTPDKKTEEELHRVGKHVLIYARD
jgi:hypothetical protein